MPTNPYCLRTAELAACQTVRHRLLCMHSPAVSCHYLAGLNSSIASHPVHTLLEVFHLALHCAATDLTK